HAPPHAPPADEQPPGRRDGDERAPPAPGTAVTRRGCLTEREIDGLLGEVRAQGDRVEREGKPARDLPVLDLEAAAFLAVEAVRRHQALGLGLLQRSAMGPSIPSWLRIIAAAPRSRRGDVSSPAGSGTSRCRGGARACPRSSTVTGRRST